MQEFFFPIQEQITPVVLVHDRSMIEPIQILLDINFLSNLVPIGLYLQMIECKQSQI